MYVKLFPDELSLFAYIHPVNSVHAPNSFIVKSCISILLPFKIRACVLSVFCAIIVSLFPIILILAGIIIDSEIVYIPDPKYNVPPPTLFNSTSLFFIVEV